MLNNIVQAFNPQAWAKCDELRHAKVFESVHMQHLTAQLCDHEAKIWGLHEQTFNVQQEVDCECHHADKAETELRFIKQMGRSPSKRERHEPMVKRASHLSTLKYRTP